jgi:hypothetical protein
MANSSIFTKNTLTYLPGLAVCLGNEQVKASFIKLLEQLSSMGVNQNVNFHANIALICDSFVDRLRAFDSEVHYDALYDTIDEDSEKHCSVLFYDQYTELDDDSVHDEQTEKPSNFEGAEAYAQLNVYQYDELNAEYSDNDEPESSGFRSLGNNGANKEDIKIGESKTISLAVNSS